MNVLGVKVDDVSMDEAVATVDGWIGGKGKHYITTPNPEIIMAAQNDPEFKKILNGADLAIPDGVGLRLAGVKNRLAGVDLMLKLVKLAAEKGYTVGFLGGRDRVAEKTAERLVRRYPKLKVGYIGEEWDPGKLADILFVAFGHGKQERWIAQNLDKIPVKVAMAVGGAFDYISGKVPRAPEGIRKIGFEWLFRLIIQPWRIKRQMSLIKFLWLIFSKRDA